MNENRRYLRIALAVGGAVTLAAATGCFPSTLWANLTKERTGNITMLFINNTPYRAVFSCATWDEWDRSPGPITLEQRNLDGNTTLAPLTLVCRRNAAVGTDLLVRRVIDLECDLQDGFQPEAFDTVVRFSRAPGGSDAAPLPTEGTALGVGKLLGVDYSCGDQLVFTFEQDPDAPGGFRIDFQVILDQPRD